MAVGTLDIVSMTMGEVIPSSQVKTIQHLEGGIVLEILVREGQAVTKDQPLVVLEQTFSGADVAELRVRLNSLTVDIKRLENEAAELPELSFDAETQERFPELVMQAIERFDARRKSRENNILSQQQSIQQRKDEINEIEVRTAGQREALKLQNEKIAISNELLKENLSNRFLHLDLLSKANELKAAIDEGAAALTRAQSALHESETQLQIIYSDAMAEVRGELDGARLEYRELWERLKKYEDSLRRTTLRSPVDGLIKTVHVTTIGGVIKAGDPVVDIVPGEDRLVIEAQLPTQDIGYVEPGQPVMVKLTSADAARFGNLMGVVDSIGPDTHMTPEGSPYYKVRVETEMSYFERGKLRYHLYPGMQVMANIRTGERTLFQYFFDPIFTGMGDAMQER